VATWTIPTQKGVWHLPSASALVCRCTVCVLCRARRCGPSSGGGELPIPSAPVYCRCGAYRVVEAAVKYINEGMRGAAAVQERVVPPLYIWVAQDQRVYQAGPQQRVCYSMVTVWHGSFCGRRHQASRSVWPDALSAAARALQVGGASQLRWGCYLAQRVLSYRCGVTTAAPASLGRATGKANDALPSQAAWTCTHR
jgi:hypothetical protein